MTATAGRIALVTDGDGEARSTARDDLRGLRDRGWDARLITPADCARRAPRLSAALALARAGARRRGAARRSLGAMRTWCGRELAGRVIAFGPRLVHFDSGRVAADWRAVTDGLGRPVVVAVTAQDLYAAGSEPFPGADAVWARAAAFHFDDEALELRALQRGLPERIPRAVIAPSVDTDFFSPPEDRPPASGTLRIVSSGALDWKQGLEHAIHALRLLRDAGVTAEYTILGEGEHLAALTFARHQLGVEDEVEFAGAVAADELRRQLRRADVFVSAAVVDGVPRPALQALACGTPAVISDPSLRGDAEIDARAALVVPRRDPEALADALASLAGDEGRRRDMGRAARAWAVDHVPRAQRLAGLDRLFRDALAQ